VSSIVAYHAGADGRYSLQFASAALSDAAEHISSRPNHAFLRYHDTLDLYLVYSRSPTLSPTEVRPSEYEHPVLATLASLFTNIVTTVNETDGVVTSHKPVSLTGLEDRLGNRVPWRTDVPSVAGAITSTAILHHGLPNANHRTSLLFGLVYLSTMGVDPATVVVSGPIDDAFVRSKQLLTVRRNAGLFSTLKRHGCSTVIRRGGIEIPLDNWEFPINDVYRTLARSHRNHWQSYFTTYTPASATAPMDAGYRTFRDRLSSRLSR
jgi:hypothetical protein